MAAPTMPDPSFSAVCLTYARPERLAEAVECFRRQTFCGLKELIVFNSFPEHQIQIDGVQGVRVINCATRPATLGAARNAAIELAQYEYIVTWDDDDIYLPLHLQNFADACAPEAHWLWMDKAFGSEFFRIKHLRGGFSNTFAFRKTLWKAVGGYPPLDCGEDAAFVTKAANFAEGRKFTLDNEKASFIYGWNNKVHHISGVTPGRPSSRPYHKVAVEAAMRLRAGKLPRGQFKLAPKWERDWGKMAMDFCSRHKPAARPVGKSSSTCILELGRFGDIINILPIARMIAERYEVPALMVSKEFASILDGVSYVKPHVIPVAYNQVNDAMRLAKREYKRVIVTQIHGVNFSVKRLCPSFSMESWRMAGMLHLYEDKSLRPLFDLRSAEREAELVKRYLAPSEKPTLLINFTACKSTPFKRGAELQQKVVARFAHKANIVDLARVSGERFYDLIGLMERAHGLVSVDTGTVHLVGATLLPTVVLVPEGWAGAIPRCELQARVIGEKALSNPELIYSEIEKLLAQPSPAMFQHAPVLPPPKRKLIHCTERHKGEDVRTIRAQRTWDKIYEQGVVPVHLWEYPRSAKQIGDKRDLPYLKDVLKPALDRATDEDIIFFTNDDIMIHPDLPEELKFHVGLFGVGMSTRCDWKGGARSPKETPDMWVRAGTPHSGRDLFAFTGGWLRAHWEDIPDAILGASDWDYCMAFLIMRDKGIAMPERGNMWKHNWPADMMRGYIGHEFHAPKWAHPANENIAASQKHNRTLCAEWCRKHGLKFWLTGY